MSTAATPHVPPPSLACPRCRGAMNRHAEKIDTRIAPDQEADFADLGGALCEIHTCPACQYTGSVLKR